jgi:hypothetical protein
MTMVVGRPNNVVVQDYGDSYLLKILPVSFLHYLTLNIAHKLHTYQVE